MHRFRVWAPLAQHVNLVLSSPRTTLSPRPMQSRENGWWTLSVPEAGHGTDYAFSLNDGPPRPDPRGLWLPYGVHGPSRVFDPGAAFSVDRQWPGRDVLGTVFYEVHVGTFTREGTLDAARTRLDYLVDLGVDVVELMPVTAFDGRWGWGYDTVSPFAVHEPYGGPAALQRFVQDCHDRGLAVCLDVVHNHLGPSGNYLPEFGPYFTDRHRTPWGHAMNLDGPDSAEVRRWICDSALGWLRDFQVDALRLDAVHALHDDSPRHLLQQLSDEASAAAHDLGRPLALIAESDRNDPRTIDPTQDGGLGMTAQWADDVHHAVHTTLTGERHGYYIDFGSLDVLARTLTRVFRHAGDHSTFRGVVWGHPVAPERHRGHRFVAFLQNHDQVGNRAQGDRIGELLSPGLSAAGAAIILTSPFTPLVFMGEEWAAGTPWRFFADFPDPALAEAVRIGRRREFADHGWPADEIPDPQDPATKDVSILDWSEPGEGEHARQLNWYRALIALRRHHPGLRADDLTEVRVEHDPQDAIDGPRWLVMHRDSVHVLVNLGPDPVLVPAPIPARLLLAWNPIEPTADGWLVPGETAALVDDRMPEVDDRMPE